MVWESWQIWSAIGMCLLVLEVFVPGFVLACLGLGSFGGALAAHLNWSLEGQMTVVGLTALVSFIFLRPLALRWGFRGNEAVSGTEALIGKECTVTQSFDPQNGMGRCKIDGDDWRAMLENRSRVEEATAGTLLIIAAVESNTLIVTFPPNSPTP